MLRDVRRPSAALLLACLTSLACAGSGGPGTAEDATPPEPDLERLEALYRARMDSARMNVHPADVAFMTGMIGHHAQALVMSDLAPARGASPTIRTLAARITNAQRDEIGLMQRWLRDRGRPVPEVGPDGRMTGAHGDHAMHMPGMLSEAQLDTLRAARGGEFDRRYLAYMIQHHQGAVTMVHELFATDGAAQDDLTFKLASDIQVDQRSEVARMQRMLDALSSR